MNTIFTRISKRLAVWAVALCSCVVSAQDVSVPQKGLDSITPGEMKHHVYVLADDGMQGRDTPSPELDSAAAYIAGEFESYGLEKLTPENGYYQYFNVLRSKLSEPNTFSICTVGDSEEYRLKYDFVPMYTTANSKVDNKEVVFAGYGITAPEYGYDDYEGIDVQDKIVCMFKNEPQMDDSASVFEGLKSTDYSKIRLKTENALEHGAVGIIFLSDPTKPFRRPPNSWPSLMRNAPENAVPLTLEEHNDKKLVCMSVGRNLSNDLFEGSGMTPLSAFDAIDSTGAPCSMVLSGRTVTMQTMLDANPASVKNVAAMIRGSDPALQNEYIIIGGHYDHVGVQNNEIYNGADDNASGTAGVMEIAEAFACCGEKPKRSVIFIAFAGEEKGLFGSRFFASNPVPCKAGEIVAMLNMDMISRNDSNEVAIIGSKTSNFLKEANEKVNTRYVHMDLAYDMDRYFLQSDHYSFYKIGVPVLFYNTKDTPDLHRPTDDPEKIIPEKMSNIGKLVFSTAWITANSPEKPDYIKVR